MNDPKLQQQTDLIDSAIRECSKTKKNRVKIM